MKGLNQFRSGLRKLAFPLAAAGLLCLPAMARAGVGDPQIRTDHPWYPGELAISTFERLFATQAEQHQRVKGARPETDEQKAIASWLFRNTHYWHGEEGTENLWGNGFAKGGDLRSREYWTGLFAHGFGLCGTTHSQWTAEMQHLFGHGRGRGVGVKAHNAFEVFLKGGPYADGKWVLLDHDISTIVYDEQGRALLSIPEIKADLKRWIDPKFMPQKQDGWLVCGLHPGDGTVYEEYNVAEYLAGYAGPPPMVNLRRGESLRRYLEPGLEDGKTFVFWGRNYNSGGIPGPERSRTWVNQPDQMHGAKRDAGHKTGQARYANAVYTYRPDFRNGDYKESVVEESASSVTFEFQTPYIIGATPANDSAWGIYEPGGRNGLVLRGKAGCAVAVSVDRGRAWKDCGTFAGGMDLTDHVKGHRQYWLRLGAGARALAESGLTITTVCQANVAVLPRLKDGGSTVTFQASGRGMVSAGPNLDQARAHLVAGEFNSPAVTLALATPRKEPVAAIYAAAHVASGNPPRSDILYQIEYSIDAGRSWKPVVKDWTTPRMGEEPKDFWSQSFCYGSVELDGNAGANAVQVRFRNNGGRRYLRAEVHLIYQTAASDAAKVTFAWTDVAGPRQHTHVVVAGSGVGHSWEIPTGRSVKTRWVEMEPVAR